MHDRSGGRVYRVEAIILRRVSTGETDRVLTVFTRDRGKLGAIAKGARGPRSRLGGVTEPFTYFHGLLAQGQNLDVLTQAEVQNAFMGIRKDLVRIGYATYFLELVDAGIEERQPMPALWDLTVGALTTLEAAETPDVLCRAFEFHALRQLGYEPRLMECVRDGESVDAPHVGFHPLRGGMLCPRCARSVPGSVAVSAGTVAALREISVAPLVYAANSDYDETVRRELTRCLIPYVRHHLESPLRSLQFLDDVTAAAVEPSAPGGA